MKNYLLFSFLKYKNRSSSSSIATNKKKKKGSNFFLSKTSPFFLRSCVISTNPFLPFASSSDDQSPSSIAARALRGMFLSDSDPLFELTFRVRITFVCVYMLSRLQLIKYLFLSPIICLLFSIGDFFLRSYFVSDRDLVRDSDSNFLAFLKLVQQMLAPHASMCNT